MNVITLHACHMHVACPSMVLVCIIVLLSSSSCLYLHQDWETGFIAIAQMSMHVVLMNHVCHVLVVIMAMSLCDTCM